MSSDIVDKEGQLKDSWLSFQVRVLKGYFKSSYNRNKMIKSIKNGLTETRKKRLLDNLDIVIDNPDEDEISLKVLMEWKTLSKEAKQDYYIFIVTNSQQGLDAAMIRAQEKKLALRNRFKIFGGMK